MDVVVTIPKKEYKNDDRETQAFMEEEGSCQFWTFARKPTMLKVGDRMHFVKHGRVESSMRVFRIEQDTSQKCDVTERVWEGGLIAYMDDLQYHGTVIESKGFQGFRYKWWD